MKKATTLFLTKNASHQLFVNKFTTPFIGFVQNSRQLLQYGFLFVLLLPFCSKLNATNGAFCTILRDSIPQKNAVAPTSIYRWEYSEDQVNWRFYSNEEYIQAHPNKTTYYRRWVSLRSNPKSVVDVNQVYSFLPNCGVSTMSATSTSCGLNNGIIGFFPDQTTETSFSLEQYNSTTGQFSAFQTISSGNTYNLPPGTYRVVSGGGTCITGPVTIASSSIPAGPPIASVTASNQFDCIYGNMGFQVVMYSADPGLQYRINGGPWQSDPNFSGFTYGTYLFEAQTVIDATCTSGISSYQNTFSEVEPPVIQNVNLANVTDCTLNNASASVTLSQGSGIQFRINGGAWQWSNLFTNLSKGNYYIEAQTSGNITCSSGNYSFSVDETKGLQITGHTLSNLGACGTTATNVSITLQSNATAFSPSVQYKLGNGAWQSSAVFSGLSAGTYAFYIKAADGCTTGTTSNYSVTISNSNVPVISSVTTSNDNDCSVNNVALKVIVQDTTVGIKYRINGGAWGNASTFTGLTSGTYLLEAAPSSNLTCIASITKTIVETGSVTISSITVANQTDCTPNNVILTAVHNGGTQTGLEFQLTGTGIWQANNPQFTGLASNTYSIQARVKSSTCTYPVSVKTITVTETFYPTIVSDTVTGIKDCIKNNARATLRLQNSSMPAQYRITNLSNTWQTSNVFSNLTTGVYQVQVAAQGNTTCIQNYTLNVDEGLGAIDSLRVTNYNDCTNRNIQIKANYTASPLSNIQFRINGGAYQASPIFTGLTTGTFLVESNTANGCKSSRSTGTITEVLVPEITNLQASNDADCIVGNMNATVLYTTNGVTLGPITFRLNGGAWQSGVNFSNLPSGTYLVEASSTKCFAPKQVTLNEKKPPIIQDVVITNTADTCASRLDFKVILSNFDSTQQYQ